ncbi:MAG TPA: carboxypeptidase regulatory-like domain-containing protein [Terriglobales bacterium]|nr:carboxypeptidase regulatory-like domain-containing protein [Terriglobales bacterium]
MKIRLFCGIAVLLAMFSAVNLFAQDTGDITGTVRDNTGAVIPGADVKIIGTAGGVQRDTTTNNDGGYLEAGLPGGTYNIIVSSKGFKTFKGNGVVLRVGQRARVDATLTVGDIATEIVVQGEDLNQVETQSSDLSGTVTGRQLSQLQLNGRNFTQLLGLAPGVTNQVGVDDPGEGLSTVAYSVNGGRTEYNNWEIDGGNNMDDGSNTTLLSYPSLDSIAEVRVMSSNYGAQYGRNSSGTVELETKSGTNKFHGDVFEYIRNDYFNADNYFTGFSAYKKNDWGFTIGGPVIIPHLYDGKNKTFFFYSGEWRRDRVPGAFFNVATPTCEERGLTAGAGGVGCTGTQAAFGDFSALCPGQDCPINPATGNPFPNNQVPIDPLTVPLLAFFSAPTSVPTPGYGNYTAGFPSPTNFDEELFKIDQNIGSKWHVNVRYIHDSWNSVSPVPLWTDATSYPTIQDAYNSPTTSLIVHMTTTITPTLLNEFVAGYSANHIVMQNVGPSQRPAGYTLGLFQNGFGGNRLPGVILNGGNQFAGGGIGLDTGYVPNGPVNSNPSYTYRDNVSKIIGKHNLTIGGYFVASQKNEIPQVNPSVNGLITLDTSFSTANTASTGNPFADLLAGNLDSFQQASGQGKYYLRYKIFEPYFQDDWHVTPRLTLNLGLRISLFGTVYGRLDVPGAGIPYNFDPAKYDFTPGATVINLDGTVGGTYVNPYNTLPGLNGSFNGIVKCGAAGIPAGCAAGHLFNPAPRLGFAYDPFGDGKWAIRGGYGIFFEHTNGNEAVATQLEGSPPGVQNPSQGPIGSVFNSSGQVVTSGYSLVGASLNAAFPESGIVSLPNKQIWPYVQQFHFDVEHQLPWHVVGIVSYVGSKGTHLGTDTDINQLKSVAEQGLTNPYKPGEAMGPNDCTTGQTPSGVTIPGYTIPALFNPNVSPAAQYSGAGVNMFVACGGNASFFRPYLGYGSIHGRFNGASSIYHGLEMSARKTVGALQVSLSYTWSHSIDDASSAADTALDDTYNFAANRASSNFDQRHVFTASYIYDLPFFRSGGLTHKLLGGWQYSGITTFSTGAPFTVSQGSGNNSATTNTISVPADNAGVANGLTTGASRPDLVGNPNGAIPAGALYGSNFAGPLLVNPAAFAAPQGLTFGDTPRNDVRNPHQINFDMALYKHFTIKEGMAFEFRTEAFNVFNHTEWGYIGGGSGSAAGNGSYTGGSSSVGCYGPDGNAGYAGAFAGDPNSCVGGNFLRPGATHNARILQLALKFIF